jgi:hypothetical protein
VPRLMTEASIGSSRPLSCSHWPFFAPLG